MVRGILTVLEVTIFVVIFSLIEDLDPEYGFSTTFVLSLSSGWSRSTIGVESGRYVGFIDKLESQLDYQWMSLANV